MGLIVGLLTLPLAPVRGVAWVAEQVALEAERQTDEASGVRRELAQLELDLDLGRIAEDEYERQEALLLERLERTRNEGV